MILSRPFATRVLGTGAQLTAHVCILYLRGYPPRIQYYPETRSCILSTMDNFLLVELLRGHSTSTSIDRVSIKLESFRLVLSSTIC